MALQPKLRQNNSLLIHWYMEKDSDLQILLPKLVVGGDKEPPLPFTHLLRLKRKHSNTLYNEATPAHQL